MRFAFFAADSSIVSTPSHFASPAPAESLRNQESVLVCLDLVVLGALAVTHVVFAPTIGSPSPVFFAAIGARCAMELGELAWIRRRARDAALLRYSSASIWFRIAFAFALTSLGGMQNSHYVALMVIPVIAAAFRYEKPMIALVTLTVSGLTFLHLYLYFRRGATEPAEYFEAATVVLVYFIVAAAVSLLAQWLRHDRDRLAASLSALQEARERLTREEKLAAVGRLSSAIAHEIRNPVGMIVSSLALASGGHEEKRAEMLGIAMQESRRLEALTTDFLSYARPRPLVPRETSIEGTLRAVASLAEARAAERGVAIAVECPADRAVSLDPFQIHQALLNLVANALDACAPGKTIVLRGAEEGGRVALSVENAGPPIAADAASRLFEPFFTTKARGTGLGLSIAQGIVRAHGGDLALASNTPDSVRFAILLPAEGPRVDVGEVAHGAHPDR